MRCRSSRKSQVIRSHQPRQQREVANGDLMCRCSAHFAILRLDLWACVCRCVTHYVYTHTHILVTHTHTCTLFLSHYAHTNNQGRSRQYTPASGRPHWQRKRRCCGRQCN
jgi:hypothetical protein